MPGRLAATTLCHKDCVVSRKQFFMTLRSSRKLVRPSEVELFAFTFTYDELRKSTRQVLLLLGKSAVTAVAKYFEELAHEYLKLGISGRH
ncbi:hypothetical protein PGT21_033304 [Puccinia graminis f. sp. tritici]|uniref:Uncharacterized protein n=1 Tax=Puccinia graminis f. sp. tritici TaxID=56615 RepID=A0A5B0Q7A8_PUCGR|nr:hypothetical protein PGT21_033304 [Puccinia graminis f. sp. tritici]KAA1133196.1 hypothetical protein PGTUg99_025895 [Puccinia graminis f. sp. tritici]